MAVAHAVGERLLHVGEFDEIEGGRNIDHPVARNAAGDRVDEFCKAARLLDGKVDALQDFQAVRRLQDRFAAELQKLRLDPFDQVCDVMKLPRPDASGLLEEIPQRERLAS
jgi:hypothetical protein